MTQPKPPFYVSFTNDPIPKRTEIDHSRPNPGPPGGAANRAGHTTIHSRPRLTFAWDQGGRGADGRLPVFARSVNVVFRLTDFLIAISSDFQERYCAYEVTRKHELSAHIYDPIHIFHSYRESLINRLNGVVVPTSTLPLRAASTAEAEARKAAIERQVVDIVGETRRKLVKELRQRSARHDDADHYRLVYNQCSAAEWASGK